MGRFATALSALTAIAAILAVPGEAGKPLLKQLNQQERAMMAGEQTRLEGLKKHRAYTVVAPVTVDLSVLDERGFSVDLFGIPAEVTLAAPSNRKGESRNGKVAGGGDFQYVVNEGKLHATLKAKGRSYSIFPLNDAVHVLVETDPALLGKPECGVTHE